MKAPVQTIPSRVRLSRVGRFLPDYCALQGLQGQALFHIEIRGDKDAFAMSETGYRSLRCLIRHRGMGGWKPMCAAGSISTIAVRASAKSPSNFRCF